MEKNCPGTLEERNWSSKGRHQNLTEIPYLYSVKIESVTPSPVYLYSRISICRLQVRSQHITVLRNYTYYPKPPHSSGKTWQTDEAIDLLLTL